MHLVYIEKSLKEKKGGFRVNKTEKNNQYVDLEIAFNEFSSDKIKSKMKEYERLREQEQKIKKEKTKLIESLKTEFSKKFIPEFKESHPEFFI